MKPKSLCPTGEQLSHEWAMVAFTSHPLTDRKQWRRWQVHRYGCLDCLKYTLDTTSDKIIRKNIRARIRELKAK